MIEFKVAGIECVTDITGKTLGIHGTPDLNQMGQIIATLRNLQELGLTRGKTKMPPAQVVELPPGFPEELRHLIERLLESRVRAVLFEEVPLFHFFETEAGEKFCKTQNHRAIPVLGPDQNGTEVTFNRTRVVNYLGDDRVKLFPQDGVAEEGPVEKPSVSAVSGMTIESFNNLADGSWFTDGEYVYYKVAGVKVQKYELDGEPISLETYRGPKNNLKFLSFNVLDAWDLVEEGCKASG